MDPYFFWLEETALSIWVRGGSGAVLAFPIIICFHALGMGFLVGTVLSINLRILGVASKIPLSALAKFLPVAMIAFVVNIISGVLLLIGYPTKALTNPVFYFKLSCIALAAWVLNWTYRNILSSSRYDQGELPAKAKILAALSCFLWISAIVAGRLLAYTYVRLMSIF